MNPRTRSTVVLALLCALLAGCAATPPEPSAPAPAPATPGAPAGDPVWWQVRVRMNFDAQQAVAWHLDALLADQVFAPVLERYRAAMHLWRFHRRAVHDETGHQMSLLFRADAAIAARVVSAVRASAILARLQDAGAVREVVLPGPGQSMGAGLEATSDKDWPMVIQRTWPHFIMGVSENWLALVAEIRRARGLPPGRRIGALMDAYRGINDEVDALWRVQAQHAYLHHLNAVFGYQPVLLREQRLTRF